MTVQPQLVPAQDDNRAQTHRPGRLILMAILIVWNLYILVSVLYMLSVRHRPHTQIGANNIVLGILIDSWFVVNLVIVAVAFFAQRRSSKRRLTQ